MKLTLTAAEAQDLLRAIYSGIENEDALLDAYSNCTGADDIRLRRRLALMIIRWKALRRKIGAQISASKNQRETPRVQP